MIAAIRFMPKDNFVRITGVEKIMGIRFKGIMVIGDLYDASTEIRDAYNILKSRQPEIFE